ncbi:MAG: hypothetical protein U1E35_06535 [Rhodospirillales bacterium]
MARPAEVAARLPGLAATVVIPFLGEAAGGASGIPGAVGWAELLAEHADAAEPQFERLPFEHPLYILYSSGTTGIPKASCTAPAAPCCST